MRLGVDKGTVYTKTVGITLRSILRPAAEVEMEVEGLSRAGHLIRIGDERYVVGERGDFATDLMKGSQENTKNLIYTAIAHSMTGKYDEVDLVVGLPISFYTKEREIMKDVLTKDDVIYTALDDATERNFSIRRVEVFPEGAGAFYSQPTAPHGGQKVLIVDIGGLSVDNVEFDDRAMTSYSTYQLGLLKLFTRLANEINRRYSTEVNEWGIDTVLKRGLYIDGSRVDVGFLEDIINDYVDEIVRKLRLEYDMRTTNAVILAGGGGELLQKYFEARIKQAKLISNPFKANVIGFQNIAEAIFS